MPPSLPWCPTGTHRIDRGRALGHVGVGGEPFVDRRVADHDVLAGPVHVPDDGQSDTVHLLQRRDRSDPDLFAVGGGLGLEHQGAIAFLQKHAALRAGIFEGQLHQLPEESTDFDFNRDGARQLQDGGHVRQRRWRVSCALRPRCLGGRPASR